MKLKLIERSAGDRTSAKIVDATTGEPLEGIVGYGVLAEGGVRFLQVRVAGFLEERHTGPDIVVAQAVPGRVNGRKG